LRDALILYRISISRSERVANAKRAKEEKAQKINSICALCFFAPLREVLILPDIRANMGGMGLQ
jgi:hypothetical protein